MANDDFIDQRGGVLKAKLLLLQLSLSLLDRIVWEFALKL
jgi:hypothetical protein